MSSMDSQGSVTVLDLYFLAAGTVAAFLVRTSEGPVLVETGPESLYGNLVAAVQAQGHAIHHITYQLEDGLFTGDVGGIRIGTGPVIPPFPPPDIDLEAWADSIARMRAARPSFIYPTHFGIKRDGLAHFDSLEENIRRIAEWVRQALTVGSTEEALVPAFQNFMHDLLAGHGLPEDAIQEYEIADPAFMSVHGLSRYWKKRGLGTANA